MVEHVKIQNFKSISTVSVELSPVTVLIGRSGVGKSNFLRALRFLRNYLAQGPQAISLEGGWERIWPFGSPQPVSISVRFRLPGFEAPFCYSLGWDASRQGVELHAESLSLGGNQIFAWSGKQWNVWPGPGRQPQQPPREVQLDKFPTITECVLAFTAWTSGVGWHDFPATVLMRPTAESQPLFGRTVEIRGLDDGAGNYLPVMKDLTQDLRDQMSRRQILARLKQINPTVSSAELDSIQAPTSVVIGHNVGGQKIPLDLSQESDGFRRYYAHLLAMYQTPPKQLLMFEEPENGIYPGALKNLAEEFAAAPTAGRGQVLLTTQSPDLLDGFDSENIRVVELDPLHQQTKIGHLDPEQVLALREKLLHPGELLTVDAARLAGTAGGSSR